MSAVVLEKLDKTFAALADPTRRAILEQLAAGEHLVADLARPHAISAPAVSKHLRVLEEAGLLKKRIEGNRRWCRLDPRPFRELQRWLERYDGFWDEQLDALSDYIKKAGRPDAKSAARTSKKRKV